MNRRANVSESEKATKEVSTTPALVLSSLLPCINTSVF